MVQIPRYARFVATSGGDAVVKITISGHPGSGTSTLVGLICAHYNWGSLNGGDIFRQEAAARNMSLADFGSLCSEDESVDRSLDTILQERMLTEEGPEVIESRLSGWWAYKNGLDCIRIWLDVSDEERARRVVEREGGELADALESNHARSAIDLARFEKMYSLNPESPIPYTHTVESSSLQPEDVANAVITILEGTN